MSAEINQCLSCNATLKGRFCSSCGEKVVQDIDFSLGKIVGEGLAAFTTLDNRLFRSIIPLLFKPGFLSQEYIAGRRKNYMKPFQLYILCSVLLFIFLADFDVVLIPSQWFFVERFTWDMWGLDVRDLARAHMVASDITFEEVKMLYDAKVVVNSKIGVILMVPLMAFFSYLIGRSKIKEFGKHFIISIHNFCFILLFMTLWITFFRALPFDLGDTSKYVGISIIMFYLIISYKGLFNLSTLAGIGYGLLNFIFLFIIMFLYRIYISYFTLWLL